MGTSSECGMWWAPKASQATRSCKLRRTFQHHTFCFMVMLSQVDRLCNLYKYISDIALDVSTCILTQLVNS